MAMQSVPEADSGKSNVVLQESQALLQQHPICVMLVDDQPIIAEAVRRMLEDCPDVTLHYCQEPSKVIEISRKIHPTVILQDLVMPECDGLVLVRYYRSNPLTKDIPIIVLSTKEEPIVKAEAFSLGANDYIVKLPDKLELIARIRYHSQAYIRLLERNEAFQKLFESQRLLNQELVEAANYVEKLLPEPLNKEIKAAWRFIPSAKLGGDAFGYHWLDENNFAIYLLDVCGHGVGAALLSISVANLLRSQNLPGADFFNPKSVLTELNRTFPMEMHNDMFFTIWYGVYNKQRSELIYTTGGHPPAILITGETKESAKVYELKTAGMVIGIAPDAEFENDICKVKPFNLFYVFSDGVYEIAKAEGVMMELQEFVNKLAKISMDPDPSLDKIVEYSKQEHENQPFADDFSIVQVVF